LRQSEIAVSLCPKILPLVVFAALSAPYSVVAQTATVPPTPTAQEDAKAVDVRGFVSESTIQQGQKEAFFLWIVNRTTEPIQNVSLEEVRAPGLLILNRSWCGADPNCKLITPQLNPGQSIAVSGELLGAQPHQKESIFSKIAWTDSTRKLPSSRYSLLGDVAVQTGWEHWRSSWVYDLLKDLALPIVVLAMATAFGFYDKWKENRKQKREKESEERHKKDAEVRAQTAETWNSMLRESHKLATRYYMPVDGAASSAVDELGRWQKASKDGDSTQKELAEERAFFYLLLMSRRLRQLSDDRGGWYFKDRIGEQLVARCLENFRLLMLNQSDGATIKWSLAVGVVSTTEKLGSFATMRSASDRNGEILREARECFSQWLVSANFEPALRNLYAMRLMLSYEMNRPYEYWYGGCDQLSLSDEIKKTVLDAAKTSGNHPSISEEKVSSYLKNLEA
jgi:hypothetical protein